MSGKEWSYMYVHVHHCIMSTLFCYHDIVIFYYCYRIKLSSLNSIQQLHIVDHLSLSTYVTVFPLPSDLTLASKGALSVDTQRIVLTQGQIQTLIHIYKEDFQ